MNKCLALFLLLLLPTAARAEPFSLLKGATKVQLENGLTVIIKENHSHPVVSVQVWVKVGSVNEVESTSGLSHFLEHLIFKGTAKYPGDEIARRVETQGGTINASTSKEFTNFYIDTQTSGYPDAVRILADAMANAAFPADEVEKERPVVVEEIHRHFDNPGSLLYDVFNEAMFTATPYSRSIIGTASIIENVPRQKIMDYYHEHYVPANMFLTIVGDVKPAEALKLVQETFGRQKAGPIPPQPDLLEPEHPARAIQRKKDIEQTYWFAGFLGPVITSDDQFTADVASTILGGGRSSRLFQKLREGKQLVYSIGSTYWTQRGSGMFTISALFAPEKEKETLAAVSDELKQFMDNGPTDAELKRAKEMITAQWYFNLETFHDQAATLAYWHMQGMPDLPDRYIAGINRVTIDSIKSFLSVYYRSYGLNQALLTPGKTTAGEGKR